MHAGAPDEPAQDMRFDMKARWVIDFKSNRIRKEFDGYIHNVHADRSFYAPHYLIQTFDGITMYHSHPRHKNPIEGPPLAASTADLGIRPKDCEAIILLIRDYPLFVALGRIPTLAHVPHHCHLHWPLDRADFQIRGHVMIDGRDCVILRSAQRGTGKPHDEWLDYSVDVERGSTVLRLYHGDRDGAFEFQADIRYERTDEGWMPSGWTFNSFRSGQKAVVETAEDLKVVSIKCDRDLPSSEFRIDPQPGYNVWDGVQSKFFQVGPDGELIEVDPDILDGKRTSRISTSSVFAVIGLSVVVLLGCSYWKRRSLSKVKGRLS
jgi:hypothetical protein